MSVDVERDASGRVAERTLHGYHVAAGRHEGTRVEVPQIVEGVLVRQPGSRAGAPGVPAEFLLSCSLPREEQPLLALCADGLDVLSQALTKGAGMATVRSRLYFRGLILAASPVAGACRARPACDAGIHVSDVEPGSPTRTTACLRADRRR